MLKVPPAPWIAVAEVVLLCAGLLASVYAAAIDSGRPALTARSASPKPPPGTNPARRAAQVAPGARPAVVAPAV